MIVPESEAEAALADAFGRRISTWPAIAQAIDGTGVSAGDVMNHGNGSETWASVFQLARSTGDPEVMESVLGKVRAAHRGDAAIGEAIRDYRRALGYRPVRVECEVLREKLQALLAPSPTAEDLDRIRAALVRLLEFARAARERELAGMPVGGADLDLDALTAAEIQHRAADALRALEVYGDARALRRVMPAGPRTRYTPDHVAALTELHERLAAYKRDLTDAVEAVAALRLGVAASG